MIRKSNRAASGVAITPSHTPHGGTMVNAQLPSIVEHIEKLEGDRRGAGANIRAAYKDAKSKGFNVKALHRIVRERQQDAAERTEMEATMNAYRAELGMAVELVEGGLSLREAARATGGSKSNIQRALAVPEVSHETDSRPVGAPLTAGDNDLTIPEFLKRD